MFPAALMTRKLTLFLFCAFEIVLILFVAAWSALADPKTLNSENLLTLFPICEIPSSLGQKCKYEFSVRKPSSFLEVCCSTKRKVTSFGNSTTVIEPENWFYRFEILGTVGNYTLISFEDKALNGGSYHTLSNYLLKHGKDGLTLVGGN